MSENVADRELADLRGVDLTSLISDDAGADMKTALDRVLECKSTNNNSFNNFIG